MTKTISGNIIRSVTSHISVMGIADDPCFKWQGIFNESFKTGKIHHKRRRDYMDDKYYIADFG